MRVREKRDIAESSQPEKQLVSSSVADKNTEEILKLLQGYLTNRDGHVGTSTDVINDISSAVNALPENLL